MFMIRKLREQKKLSQAELGEIVNVKKSAISKYETGRAAPSPDVLKKLAEYFNVSTDLLLGARIVPCDENQMFQMWISQEESGVLDAYRSLDVQGKNTLRALLKYLVSKQ